MGNGDHVNRAIYFIHYIHRMKMERRVRERHQEIRGEVG